MDKGSARRLKDWDKCVVSLRWRVFMFLQCFLFCCCQRAWDWKTNKNPHVTQINKVLPWHMPHVKSTPLICHMCVIYCATALFYAAFLFPLLSIHRGFLDQLPSCLELCWCSSCVEPFPKVRRSRILSTSTLRRPNLLWRGHPGPGLCIHVLHPKEQVWCRQVRRRGPGHGVCDQICSVLQLFYPSL